MLVIIIPGVEKEGGQAGENIPVSVGFMNAIVVMIRAEEYPDDYLAYSD